VPSGAGARATVTSTRRRGLRGSAADARCPPYPATAGGHRERRRRRAAPSCRRAALPRPPPPPALNAWTSSALLRARLRACARKRSGSRAPADNARRATSAGDESPPSVSAEERGERFDARGGGHPLAEHARPRGRLEEREERDAFARRVAGDVVQGVGRREGVQRRDGRIRDRRLGGGDHDGVPQGGGYRARAQVLHVRRRRVPALQGPDQRLARRGACGQLAGVDEAASSSRRRAPRAPALP
jgi:hypothetical protein